LPVAGFEQLGPEEAHTEAVMLAIRTRNGLPATVLGEAEWRRAETSIAEGLLTREADRLVLTDRGRLLADGVVRTLLAG
jgi:coproporphyrinogen III oxidase-like Fe-S oxidoreductase